MTIKTQPPVRQTHHKTIYIALSQKFGVYNIKTKRTKITKNNNNQHSNKDNNKKY